MSDNNKPIENTIAHKNIDAPPGDGYAPPLVANEPSARPLETTLLEGEGGSLIKNDPLVTKPFQRLPQHWLPGQSGNPSGRPKQQLSMTSLLRKHLEDNPEDAQAIIQALIKMGKGKNYPAIDHIFNRVDGKVAETHRIEGDVPVNIIFSAFPLDVSETLPSPKIEALPPKHDELPAGKGE